MDLRLPLDTSAIERILPHRHPFLLVDKVIEFVPDQRIVGVKAVSANEPYLSRPINGRPTLPPTILTEAVAQVGAILILAKPENKDLLIFFRGMERVRFRGPVYPGDVVIVEANVKRLRSRMGVLDGRATVNGKVVVNGTMTFALGSE
jgi:3-hydroxymyristoyl/3-hydroxydecanoyl-(acyl carrier protein) dehydratase